MKNVIPLAELRSPTPKSLVKSADGLLLDWDGCCAIDNVLVPEAAEFLRLHQTRLAIMSNNSTHTPDEMRAILEKSGIVLSPERILLAGMFAIRRVKDRGLRRAMIIGSPAMKAFAQRSGIEVVREEAQVVVLMRDTRVTYAALERAANCLAGGAKLIVANPDGSHRGANARIRLETGALLAALEAAVDLSQADTEIIGKPSEGFFQEACRIIGTAPERTVMLGDNPSTDIEGARRVGMPALLVTPTPQAFFASLI